jgi:hypothetical protein
LWHNIWISYSGTNLYIYIDGVASTLVEYGSIPASLGGSSLNLYINNSVAGYAYNIGKNYGKIKDIMLLNDSDISLSSIQRYINYGVNYVVDKTYTPIDIDMKNIYLNDPSTITITSAVDDMSYIYLGRNDGKILRGSPLLWEVRKVYSNPQETDLLNLSEGNSISDGFLKIKNMIVRL